MSQLSFKGHQELYLIFILFLDENVTSTKALNIWYVLFAYTKEGFLVTLLNNTYMLNLNNGWNVIISSLVITIVYDLF